MADRRYWAVIIKQTLLTFTIVFLVGVIFDQLTNEDGYRSPFLSGAGAVAAYLVLTSIVFVLHAIVQALYLWLFAGDDMVDSILDDLRTSRLPPPNSTQPKNFDYIEQLANDEDASPNDRVRAGVLFGGYNAAMTQGLFRALAVRKALDEAVLRYAQEAPKIRK